MVFASYIGIPDFRGATTVAFLIGIVLATFAFLPVRGHRDDVISVQIKLTLALMVSIPIVAFLLTRWPFRLSIFGERHVLPSIFAALLLASYGLCQLADKVSKPMKTTLLLAAMAVLTVFQVYPVWREWPGLSRQPYAAIADQLKHDDLGVAVFTTWLYGIGEPVAFYLNGGKHIDILPRDSARLPKKFIVLYRPAVTQENTAVLSLLDRFQIVKTNYYAGLYNRQWGTTLVELQERH
jgi:hypothetical protein